MNKNYFTLPATGSPSGSLANESDYSAYYTYDQWDNMTQSESKGDTVDNYLTERVCATAKKSTAAS